MNPLLSFFRRKILRIPADRWNYQYQVGQWDGLTAETVRINAVIDLIRKYYKHPSILEIGCGKAVMFQHLTKNDYASFTGVDLSQVAVREAQAFAAPHVHFITADMQTFEPHQSFDVIAFNESLYYAKDPAAVFARYLTYLNSRGCVIVTAFDNKYTARLWPALEEKWQPTISTQVEANTLVWNIRMYQR